jgi:hypothetical protein
LSAAPRNDTGAPVPLRRSFVELIAGIQLSQQSIVFRRATLSALWFGIAGHVFLLCLQLALFLFGAKTPDICLSRMKLHPNPEPLDADSLKIPAPFDFAQAEHSRPCALRTLGAL